MIETPRPFKQNVMRKVLDMYGGYDSLEDLCDRVSDVSFFTGATSGALVIIFSLLSSLVCFTGGPVDVIRVFYLIALACICLMGLCVLVFLVSATIYLVIHESKI